jgi:hypothetical protein
MPLKTPEQYVEPAGMSEPRNQAKPAAAISSPAPLRGREDHAASPSATSANPVKVSSTISSGRPIHVAAKPSRTGRQSVAKRPPD